MHVAPGLVQRHGRARQSSVLRTTTRSTRSANGAPASGASASPIGHAMGIDRTCRDAPAIIEAWRQHCYVVRQHSSLAHLAPRELKRDHPLTHHCANRAIPRA